MRVAMTMHVLKSGHKLLHKEASLRLSKASTGCDEVKKLTATDELENEVVYQFSSLFRVLLISPTDLKKAHNVVMLRNLTQRLELSLS